MIKCGFISFETEDEFFEYFNTRKPGCLTDAKLYSILLQPDQQAAELLCDPRFGVAIFDATAKRIIDAFKKDVDCVNTADAITKQGAAWAGQVMANTHPLLLGAYNTVYPQALTSPQALIKRILDRIEQAFKAFLTHNGVDLATVSLQDSMLIGDMLYPGPKTIHAIGTERPCTHHVIYRFLAEQLQARGIQATHHIYLGLVPEDKGNAYVTAGTLFTEGAASSFTHGIYSHLWQFLVLDMIMTSRDTHSWSLASTHGEDWHLDRPFTVKNIYSPEVIQSLLLSAYARDHWPCVHQAMLIHFCKSAHKYCKQTQWNIVDYLRVFVHYGGISNSAAGSLNEQLEYVQRVVSYTKKDHESIAVERCNPLYGSSTVFERQHTQCARERSLQKNTP